MNRSHSRIRIKNWDALGQPITLFASGEQGTWYDPSDLTTLYQDAAGTTPVTAVEQPVGLWLDKSGNGHRASQPTAASRPILSARVNRYVATSTLATQSITTLAATYTLSFSGTGTITLSGTATGVFSAGTYSVVCTAGTLTSTVSGTVSNADIRVANEAPTAPAYQRVTTATDYDAVGFPYYLLFDGVDDWLSTGNIDFTGTDKMSVFAGIRKLSDASPAIFAEISASASMNNGAWLVSMPDGGAANSSGFVSRGTTLVGAVAGGFVAPASAVFTGSADISAPFVRQRRNGSQVAQGTTTQGAGNYGNYPLYIGRRGGTSLPFTGHLYGLIIRGALTDDATTVKVENLLAGKTGVQF